MDTQNRSQSYPAHLYDETCRVIALEWMARDISSKLLGIPRFVVRGRLQRQYDTGDTGILDFWNSFEAIAGGMLLKPAVRRLTASNYTWERRTVQTIELSLFARLEQLATLPEQSNFRVIWGYLQSHPDELTRQRKLASKFTKGKRKRDLPILRKRDGKLWIDDGSGRCLRALLYEQPTIEAWVCDTHDQQPRDYWVPTSELINLVKLCSDRPELLEPVRAILRVYFEESETARLSVQTAKRQPPK